MRVAQINIVRPRDKVDPDELLERWPTLPDIASAAQRAGAEVTVVQAFHRDAAFVRDAVCYRFIAEPALPGRATGLRPARLASAAATANVIHVNGLDFARHIPVLCATNVPVLAQDHASRAGSGGERRRRALRRVAGVAFTAIEQARPFIDAGELEPSIPVHAVPESSTRFRAIEQAEARRIFAIHGDPAIAWVGRLDANKDPLTILDAIERAAPLLPDPHLWCCFHAGDLRPAVEARIARSPALNGRVHLIGHVAHDRVEMLLSAVDFFLLGSHREGSGYALIEALACGATPIVSDIPSFRALAGPAGALVPPGDPAAFADALVDLGRRDRAALRRATIARFDTALSFDRVGARLCDIYAELIGSVR